MSRSVLFLKGSPSNVSRSAVVADAVASEVQRAGLLTVAWSLADFEPKDIFFARTEAQAIVSFIEAVKGAAALVLSTPVYKAVYSGALKAVVDLIPPDALVERPILGIATARLQAHASEVDRAFRSLSGFFKAKTLDTLVVLDGEVQAGEVVRLAEAAGERVRQVARTLVDAVGKKAPAVSSP